MLKTLLSNKLAALAVFITIVLSASFVAGAEGRVFRRVPPGEFTSFPQFTVYDIKDTDDGFIWFATDQGLFRFDGSHLFRVPMPADTEKPVAVKNIAAVEGGSLIAGAASHLYQVRLAGDGYEVSPIFDGKAFSSSSGLSLANGDAVMGGDDGLIVFDHLSGKTTQIRLGDNVLDMANNVIGIAQSPNNIYALTRGGLFSIDKKLRNVAQIKTDVDLSLYSPTYIASANERLYIGTSGKGVLALDPSSGSVEEKGYVDFGNVVTSLDAGGDGEFLYVGTDGGGVTKVNLATGKTVAYRHNASSPASPANNQVYSLLCDSRNLLWVGFYQHGVDYTPESYGLFEVYDNPSIFNSRGIPVRALSFGKNYNAVGTREGVVVYIPKPEGSWDVGKPSLRSEIVISLLEVDGQLFVGTYGGGLHILDPLARRIYDFAPAKDDAVFRSGHIFSMASDSEGGLWFGTNDGLYQFERNGNERHFTSSMTALPEGNVYEIFFDSEGKGWICTETGVCLYDPKRKSLRNDIFPASFPKNTRFRTVYEDSRRRLYFVPESGYVYSCGIDFSNPRYLDFQMLQGADAKGVVEDHLGNIWISTNRGIFMADSSDNVIRFGLAAGLPSLSFLQAQPSADHKGGIWFGNAEGLLKLNESLLESAFNQDIRPVPTKIGINGKVTDIVPVREKNGSYVVNFDGSVSNIRIGFSTLTYSIEEPDEFEYKLDDGEWHRFKSDMSVNLYDLKPGRRKLYVRFASDPLRSGGKETVVILNNPYPLVWKLGLGLVILLIFSSSALAFKILAMSASRKPDTADEKTADMPGEQQSAAPQKKYAANNMSRTEARAISAKIDEIMTKEKPYLQSDLKVGMLAEMVGISSHKLSQFFSQHKDISFYDYVNKYRVDEFKRMVKDEDVRNLTLSAMADKAGFSSRASFFRYFKNIEGMSPGDYLKSHHKG